MGDAKMRIINLDGKRFEVGEAIWTLMKSNIPTERQREVTENQNEILISHTAVAFEAMLYYYLYGHLHMPPDICPSVFKAEMTFWGIEPEELDKCCYQKYVTFFDGEQTLRIMETDEEKRLAEKSQLIELSRGRDWRAIQGRVWLILNEPFFSTAAKMYFVVSSLLVAVSLFALIAGTHPEFQRALYIEEWQEYFGDDWHKYKHHFLSESVPEPTPEPEPEAEVSPEPTPWSSAEPEAETAAEPDVGSTSEPFAVPENAYARYSYLDYIEYVCVGFFSVDLSIRIVFCPYKITLLYSFLNWVDVFALAVTYATYIVEGMHPREKYEASILDILHCLQIVRVFRLVRVIKHFIGFRVLYYAFKASISDMMLAMWFLSIALLFFSAFAYFSGDDTFYSIPDAFWWAIVTMTTVGYGDMVPKIGLSKLIGALCALSGVFLLALVIPIFVNNFMLFHSYSKVWGKKQEKRLKRQTSKISTTTSKDNLIISTVA